MSELMIWTNVSYPRAVMDQLRRGIDGNKLILAATQEYSNLAKPSADENLPLADVAFGQPNPDQLLDCPRIRWVQLSSAGYTSYDREDLRQNFRQRGVMLTNSSSVYAEPCAQHLLGMMLAQARALPAALADQMGAHTWLYRPIRESSVLLNGQRVLLLGFGAIARRVVELLRPFEMQIEAVRRSPAGDETVPCHLISKLAELLPHADHVVNLLPLNSTTKQLIRAEYLSRMKPSAIFYNVGRGQTVDQEALRSALRDHRLAAAWLDVTDPEPLPPAHPLWTTPNCFITPHTAGGHTSEFHRVVEHFLANLGRYQAGQSLMDRVFH